MQRIFYAALLATCLISTGAEARHRHHHTYRHIDTLETISCTQWGCTQTAKIRHGRGTTEMAAKAFNPIGGLVAKARAYNGLTASQIGLNRHSQWCAAFIRHLGVSGPVDDRAISFLKLPHTGAQVGAIAVFPHHVGIVTGFDANGNPVLISGNSVGRRVYEGSYPRRPLAYVSG